MARACKGLIMTGLSPRVFHSPAAPHAANADPEMAMKVSEAVPFRLGARELVRSIAPATLTEATARPMRRIIV